MTSTPRTPARDTFDAVIDLVPARGLAREVVALLKLTYSIDGGRLLPAAPEPLKHDIRDPSITPRLPVGTDFFWTKLATDFIVQGAAFAPSGKPAPRAQVAVKIGAVEKRVAVSGRRVISWTSLGKPRFDAPEPFESVDLTFFNAYGGMDVRVPVEPPTDLGETLRLGADHPGVYPRNPFGKGYFVVPGPRDEAEMPNLEDPSDLLTEDRLVTGDPRRWHAQPLPWCFHWVHGMMFPRFLHAFGNPDAWFPAPDDASLAEVRRGFLPRGYRDVIAQRARTRPWHPTFFQEASYGLVLPAIQGGEPVTLEGMHPEERAIRFQLPDRPPSIVFDVEGERRAARPRLHTIVARPAEKKVTLVYGADAPLARAFIPGVHKYIPVSVSIDGGPPLAYEPPVPVKEQIRRAQEQA